MSGSWQVFMGSLLLYACERGAPSTSLLPSSGAGIAATAETAPRSPAETLDRLDLRAAVPLLPAMANHQKQSMREHLVAVQEIIGGLATDDFASVERAASRMSFSETMSQMCSHMGAGATGFTEQALNFHHTADTITAAAGERDPRAVLTAVAATLRTCTSCHAMWKQQVVDERAWQQATSASAEASHPSGVHE